MPRHLGRQRQASIRVFKVRLVHIVNSRIAKAIKREIVSQNENKQKKKEKKEREGEREGYEIIERAEQNAFNPLPFICPVQACVYSLCLLSSPVLSPLYFSLPALYFEENYLKQVLTVGRPIAILLCLWQSRQFYLWNLVLGNILQA